MLRYIRIQVVLFSSVSTVGSPVAEAVITSTWDAREETKVRVFRWPINCNRLRETSHACTIPLCLLLLSRIIHVKIRNVSYNKEKCWKIVLMRDRQRHNKRCAVYMKSKSNQ